MQTDEMSLLIQGNINLQLKVFARYLKIYFKDEKKNTGGMKTSGIFLLAHFVRLDKWSINEGTSNWWQLFICPGMKSSIHRRHILLRIRLLHSQRSQFPPNCPVFCWSSLDSHQVSSLPNGPLINPRGCHTRQSWHVCVGACLSVCISC